MSLSRFGLRDFRCFREAELELGDINLVIGPNGAGKTSLIESIFFLGQARSFRTARLDSLTREGADRLQVFGTVEASSRAVALGIERDAAGLRARLGGEAAQSVAALAELLPVLVIEPHSHQLIEGGPRNRRRFMDWGTFHVEHAFLAQWRRYRHALAQRNALLKQAATPRLLRVWDNEFAQAAAAVDGARSQWLTMFTSVIPTVAAQLLPDTVIEFRYRRGWAKDHTIEEAVQRAADTDRERGVTSVGPHRADLAIYWDGQPAQDRVSRGQQKLLAITLLLSQARLYAERRRERCVLLVDDPAAELDEERLDLLLRVLGTISAQLVVTGTHSAPLQTAPLSPARVFHVEQGTAQRVV
ncbi:MAG TPA: DNA replication/repair protein RecF [Gammaproteobacteria bacterium]|nr:DNA replication/repair protein RecF [Gammaproteobacteria bacterium]